MNFIHEFYCTNCRKWKPLVEFYVGSPPTRGRCITCHANRQEFLDKHAAGSEQPKRKNRNGKKYYQAASTLKFFQTIGH